MSEQLHQVMQMKLLAQSNALVSLALPVLGVVVVLGVLALVLTWLED